MQENEEYVEGKLRFAGGRREQATYGEVDAEDVEIEKAARRASNARSDVADPDAAAEAPGDEAGGEEEEQREQDAGASTRSGAGAGAAAVEGSSSASEGDYTCTQVLQVPLDCPKVLVREAAERVAAATVMRGVPGAPE